MSRFPRLRVAKADLLLLILFALPLATILGRLAPLPWSETLADFFSLATPPAHFAKIVDSILFVPLGALVVVIFRLTLGIRVLGLFRPILLAMAFDIIGIPLSLGFLMFVLSVIVILRPHLAASHNYARIAIVLSVAAALLLASLMLGRWWDVVWLRELTYFPVIALGLTCESFAKTLDSAGAREAVWRTLTTIMVACVTTWVAGLGGGLSLLSRFPELLLALAGCVVLVSRYLDLRLLEDMNPFARQLAQSRADASANAPPVQSPTAGD